jgi:hypothetical protein
MPNVKIATTNIQLMNDWCPSQLKRLENACQQIENKGRDPQVIDLIHKEHTTRLVLQSRRTTTIPLASSSLTPSICSS